MNFAVSSEEDFSESPPACESIGTLERWLAFGLLGCALVLRLLYIWHYRIDSDEPQHLHVVWAWTQGLLPYHDVFDNHSPLFQALYAPLFHLLGVRPDILLPMRAGELPFFILTIFCVWKIARSLFAPRVALWTAVLATLLPSFNLGSIELPSFYLDSIEFRPDQLWTLVWLLILLVLSTGPIGARRMALAGLLCGLSFCVSMKTTLLLAALVQALIGALIVRWIAGGFPLRWPHIFRCSAAWLVGFVIVPALVALFFYERGVWRDMYYCVIQHNVLPGASHRVFGSAAIKTWLKGLIGAIVAGAIIVRLQMPIPVRARIAFVFFAPFLYFTTLEAAWPVLTAEDFLPFLPAMMITAAPAVLWLANRLVRHTFPVGGVLAVLEMVCILVTASPFQDQTADKIGIVADTLKLTEPSDYVMDSKGETIYRRRPFFYVLESLTHHRMEQGIVKDTIADALIEKHVPLATTQRMPHRAREFIKKNYVPIAFRLYVLGKVLRDKGVTPGAPCAFEIKVPARYTLVDPNGTPAGQLDGTTFTGPRELTTGKHSFLPDGDPGKVVLIWAPAIERGYSPFAKIKKDYKTPQD